MEHKQLTPLKNWFDKYTKGFLSSSDEDNRNIILKIEHTHHVCENIILIAGSLPSLKNEIVLAEIIALFHDIGRFQQYQQYRTFRDAVSINHGKLGAKILIEKGILDLLDREERELVLSSVKLHNTFSLPHLEDARTITFLKLIRDADKLDIWRVFSEHFEADERERASAAGLGLPDTSSCSEKILARIHEKKMASLADLHTQNDFKLMQLSWVFDLNFSTSFRLFLERDYLNRLGRTLPESETILNALRLIREFASQKALG